MEQREGRGAERPRSGGLSARAREAERPRSGGPSARALAGPLVVMSAPLSLPAVTPNRPPASDTAVSSQGRGASAAFPSQGGWRASAVAGGQAHAARRERTRTLRPARPFGNSCSSALDISPFFVNCSLYSRPARSSETACPVASRVRGLRSNSDKTREEEGGPARPHVSSGPSPRGRVPS